ncbi:MAG: hypothetical protein V2I33_23270 [Kangiellaceae bacterium]|nr:hypothetical protein [Kangiellaceae bacterium]
MRNPAVIGLTLSVNGVFGKAMVHLPLEVIGRYRKHVSNFGHTAACGFHNGVT